jgi:iron complex transport system ATP-binding protein
METCSVVLEGVRAGYDGRTVLYDLSARLDAGTVVALLGPNGSGKTTLLRVLSKVLTPSVGSVLLGGDDLRNLSTKEAAQRVAVVPQFESPAFDFSVREIVAMARYPWGDQGMRHVEQALKLTEMFESAERKFSELSGGERRRALLARALAQDTPVLLMDEPTAHMDIAHQLQTLRLARELAEAGRLVIAAMHDFSLTAAFADRVLLLHEGRVVQDGLTDDVLSSGVLDEVFGTHFERIRNGRLIVVPRSLR